MAEESSHRSGFVSIVGRPNVGKSTLMNRIVGEKVAITTPRPQTTRDRIRGICTYDDWQAVFVDTPGIHEAKSKLNHYMVEQAKGTLGDVDVALLLIDAPALHRKRERVLTDNEMILEALRAVSTPVLLVLNKVDRLPGREALLPLIETLAPLHPWQALIPVSALKGDGVEQLLAAICPLLPLGAQLFPEDQLTDRSLRFLAAEIVREQLFLRLREEVPYSVAVSVDSYEERADGLVEIEATIHVARDSHKGIVIGKGGAQIKEIGQKARLNLERFLDRRVFLGLRARVEENWTDRPAGLRKLGYGER